MFRRAELHALFWREVARPEAGLFEAAPDGGTAGGGGGGGLGLLPRADASEEAMVGVGLMACKGVVDDHPIAAHLAPFVFEYLVHGPPLRDLRPSSQLSPALCRPASAPMQARRRPRCAASPPRSTRCAGTTGRSPRSGRRCLATATAHPHHLHHDLRRHLHHHPHPHPHHPPHHDLHCPLHRHLRHHLPQALLHLDCGALAALQLTRENFDAAGDPADAERPVSAINLRPTLLGGCARRLCGARQASATRGT